MATRTGIQHAICVTDDEDGVTARLRAVLGLPAGAGTLAWEPGTEAPIATILGPESSGTIEVVRLPAELRGRLTPGTTGISFAVDDLDDLDDRVAACRAAGLPVTVVPGDILFAVVTAAGLDFELVAVVV
jgi:catechol 2,3-dioxygenase-like lactoylglutathione lyase family enzyme